MLSEVEPILFNYEDVPLRVTNNGHSIQVDYAPGSFILFGGVRYELLHFHFHTPAENRINGRVFDMAAHLVHRSAQGRLAVVAVMFTAGRQQAMLQAVWAAMPGTRDRTRERLDVAINARQMLPACERLSKSAQIWRRTFFGPEKCFGGPTKTVPRSRVKGRLRLYAAWRSEPLTRRRGNTMEMAESAAVSRLQPC